jgi:hypothetical protein
MYERGISLFVVLAEEEAFVGIQAIALFDESTTKKSAAALAAPCREAAVMRYVFPAVNVTSHVVAL